MPSSAVPASVSKQQQKTIVRRKRNNLSDSILIYECLHQLLDTLVSNIMKIEKSVRGVR